MKRTIKLQLLSLTDFVRNKRAAGRPRDLLDIELLRDARGSHRR